MTEINLIVKGSFLIFLSSFLSLFAIAQQNVAGKIIGPNGQPIVGATVTVRGTSIATTTSPEGTFTIAVPSKKSVLLVTNVGYEPIEINVAGKTFVDATVKLQKNDLNEVVVTGYTTQKKRDLTGAVSIVKVADLNKVAAPSFAQQLEGRATGVKVTTSGAAGDGASIRIRGTSTFSPGGGDPLIVIDGMQVKGAYFNDINPNDIESMQVLKDAATTAAYGIGASAGVIIISTKKGKNAKSKIEYSGYYGSQKAVKSYNDFMIGTSQEYGNLLFQQFNNSATPINTLPANSFVTRVYGNGATPVIPEYVNPIAATVGGPVVPGVYNYPNNLIMKANKQGTNWWDAVMRTAPITEQNISASGGTDKGRYFFSFNYFNQEGTMRYTDFRRYTVRGNTEFKVGAFTLGENISLGFSNGVGLPNGNQSEQSILVSGILKQQPIIPVYDEGGNWGGNRGGFGNGRNGLAELNRNKDNRGEYFRTIGNVYADVKFLNHFTARVNFGLNFGVNFFKGFTFLDPEAAEPRGANGFTERTERFNSYVFNQQVNYDNQFGNHVVKVTALHEAQLNKFRGISGSLSNYFLTSNDLWYLNSALADPSTRTVNSYGSNGPSKESYMGRLEYSFAGKYLINATARYDQSSIFPIEKGKTFGGVGLAWNVSSESFLKNVSWISNLKLRAAYGVTGNDAIDGSRAYSSFGGGAGTTFYDINGTNNTTATGYTATSLGNPGLLWEEQKQTNIGVDALFLNSRLDITFDVYNRENKNFLFQRQYPGTFPYDVSTPFENLGKISNKGFELGINWKDDINKDFHYGIGVNLTHNVNKIVDLAASLGVKSFFPPISESRIGPLVRHEIGHPMSTFYGYTVDGFFQTAAEAAASTQSGAAKGSFRWKDINGDKKIDENDKGVLGDPNAALLFGINLSMEYKGIDFSMFLQGTQGNEIFNYSRYFTDFNGFNGNRSKRMLYESWSPANPNAKLPMLSIDEKYSFAPSSYYIEDGSYLRCKVLQIGYKLPATMLKKMKIDALRFYVQAQNLFTITNYGGLDPELGNRTSGNAPDPYSGIDYGNYPGSKNMTVGLNLTF